MASRRPMTPDDAIYDIQSRLVGLEKTLIGTPGTDDKGLCGDVRQTMALAVENKDTGIDHGNRLTALETRAKYGDNPGPSKKKKAGFVGTLGGFCAAFIYALGVKCGWW